MWTLLLQTTPPDPGVIDSFVAYGIAGPLILVLTMAWRKAVAERDAERARVDALTERVIKQHEDFLPITKDLLDFMERWERSL